MAYFVGPEEGHNSVRLDGEVHVLRNETTGHSRRYCILSRAAFDRGPTGSFKGSDDILADKAFVRDNERNW